MNYSGILYTEKISRIYRQKVCSVYLIVRWYVQDEKIKPYTIIRAYTLDSWIVVAPGIMVAPSYENFYTMILLLFYINLGIAVIFQFFFLRNFSKINNSRATTIQEVRVIA